MLPLTNGATTTGLFAIVMTALSPEVWQDRSIPGWRNAMERLKIARENYRRASKPMPAASSFAEVREAMESIAARDGIESATVVFRSLIADRLSDKYKAVAIVNDPAHSIDLPTLRTLLLKAINKDFYPRKEDEQDDPAIASTRSWLLGTLGRISAGDDEATAAVVRHVDIEFEPYDWARYWSLEGLISGKNPQAEAIAKAAAKKVEDPMVAILATAFLASLNDRKALGKVKECMEEAETRWYVLRALRIVPLPATVPAICAIVEKAAYDDVTYDAIMALAVIPGDWSQSAMAAQALSACILRMRGAPWKDGMRTGAIIGLGNLRIESSGPLLIEELTDDNPAVVREAARSTERILGLSVTVIRIVEAATKSAAGSMDAYANALRWLNREAVAEELATLMGTGSAKQQDVARTLLSNLGGVVAFEKLRARTDAMKQYYEVLEKTEKTIRDLFEASVREAQSGFHYAVIMDVVVFTVGIILLVASAGYALFNTGRLDEWVGVGVSGGLGVLGIVYGVLISNPRRQVRISVDHLMRVKMVFLAYLRRLHQADQAYTRRLLDDKPITFDEVKGFSDVVGHIMERSVQQELDRTSNADTPAPGSPGQTVSNETRKSKRGQARIGST